MKQKGNEREKQSNRKIKKTVSVLFIVILSFLNFLFILFCISSVNYHEYYLSNYICFVSEQRQERCMVEFFAFSLIRALQIKWKETLSTYRSSIQLCSSDRCYCFCRKQDINSEWKLLSTYFISILSH